MVIHISYVGGEWLFIFHMLLAYLLKAYVLFILHMSLLIRSVRSFVRSLVRALVRSFELYGNNQTLFCSRHQ